MVSSVRPQLRNGSAGVTDTSRSVSLTFSTGRENGPSTFDLLLSLETGLQHPEFVRERAKLSNHVRSPLRTQRLSASDQHQLARHRWEDATIRRLPAERHIIAGN